MRHHALDLVLYAAMACAVLRPLVTDLARTVPMGTEGYTTVPYAMAWTFWWQADRLAHGLVGFWDAPIFHPTEHTFALSETNTLGALLMAPVTLLSGSHALGHNLFLLLALALNGFSASRLLMAIGARRLVALAGGAAVLMLPQPHQEIGVLPLVPVFGIVWSLHALLRWTRRPTWGSGALVGLALAVTYLLCFQYALFLVVMVGALGWLFLRRDLLRPRPLATLLLGAVLSGGLVAPVVTAQVGAVTEEAGFTRKKKKVEGLACEPRHYARTPWRQAIRPPGIGVAKEPGWKAFYPGTARIVLAVMGLTWALGRRRAWRWAWFLGGGALLAYAFSLGPHLALGGANLWEIMAEWVPGYSKVRSVNRWSVFFELFIVLLAGFGLQAVVDRLVGRPPEGADGGFLPARGRRRAGWALASLVLAGLLVAEIVPPPQRLQPVPSLEEHAGWGTWIQENTPEDAVLAFLPFSSGGHVKVYQDDAAWMMLGPAYRRAMVNGYSSYFPKPFRQLKKDLEGFPTREGVEALQEVGVGWVVLDQEEYPSHLLGGYPGGDALTLRFQDDRVGLDVYELARP